jgi:ribonucleoside-diphosphate reductase alpha chain
VRDELELGLGVVAVLKERYLLRDEQGRVAESTGEMMDRAAACVAAAEEAWCPGSAARWAEAFASAMRRLEFLPNSPTLMSAGTRLGLLAGCVVLPVEDSLDSIFRALGQAALLHQAGGGTGHAFSHLTSPRRRGGQHQGNRSGPVSFLSVFNTAAQVLAQGGRRRGASMAVLDVTQPDIAEFVDAKQAGGLEYFNLSVAVTSQFMLAVARGGRHSLVNPRTGPVVATVSAAALFERICQRGLRRARLRILTPDGCGDAIGQASPGRHPQQPRERIGAGHRQRSRCRPQARQHHRDRRNV